jgi:hypothetical protein
MGFAFLVINVCGIKMIDRAEISPSNRARCGLCSRKIKKGHPRTSNTHGRYFCYKCSERYIESSKKYIKIVERDFKKLKKECQKELILEELEDEK